MVTGATRVCRHCRAWFLTADEAVWFEQRNLQLPQVCRACRGSARQHRNANPIPPDTPIVDYAMTCEKCEIEFWLSAKSVAFLIEQRWAWPRRCRDCRGPRR